MIRLRLCIQVKSSVFVAHAFQPAHEVHQLEVGETSHVGHGEHKYNSSFLPVSRLLVAAKWQNGGEWKTIRDGGWKQMRSSTLSMRVLCSYQGTEEQDTSHRKRSYYKNPSTQPWQTSTLTDGLLGLLQEQPTYLIPGSPCSSRSGRRTDPPLFALKWSLAAHTHTHTHTHRLIQCFFQHPHKPKLLNVYSNSETHTNIYTHTIIHVNFCPLISSQHTFMKFNSDDSAHTHAHTHTHQQLNLTVKSSHIARDEELEAGAGSLKEVLDVPACCHLVLLLHLFGAAGQVLGHAHLKVWTWEPLRWNVMILTHYRQGGGEMTYVFALFVPHDKY